jgi:hypothetical protein
MSYFTIDTDNDIRFCAHGDGTPGQTDPDDSLADGSQNFRTAKDFSKLSEAWPLVRMVEIWNGLPGVTEVKKFTDRKTAATRIWNRIQTLKPAEEAATAKPQPAAKAPRKARPEEFYGEEAERERRAVVERPGRYRADDRGKKAAAPAKAAKPPKRSGPREGSKQALVIAMMERKGGATLTEIMKATGWQKHTVRGFVAGTLGTKLGRKVKSTRVNDERVYELVG